MMDAHNTTEMSDIIFAAIAYNGGKLCTDDKEILKLALTEILDCKLYFLTLMSHFIIPRKAAGNITFHSIISYFTKLD